MSTKSLIVILAGLAALPVAAHASAPSDVPSVRVRFADLDLAQDAGVERLYVRLRHAAQSVCGNNADHRDVKALTAQQQCATAALDRAVADIHSSRLSSRHALGAAASSVAMRD